MSEKDFYATPIFYANGKPHVGHLYSALIIDVIKKASLLLKNDKVLFTSGMDEHGQKVYNSSLSCEMNTQTYVDQMSNIFIDYFAKFEINPDKWVRTTDKHHAEAVQYAWKKALQNGFIYKARYSGHYSIADENYVDHNDNNDPNIIWKSEDCYFFKLSAFQDKLLAFFESNPDWIFPKKRYNEAYEFIKQGLKDFPISRPKERMMWGISVPDDESQVIYVWFDALLNYLSIIGYPNVQYKQFWPVHNIIGKDILKFHAIYWIAILLAIEEELPKNLYVHGWWTKNSCKVSKTKGGADEFDQFVDKFGVDGIRYFLLSAMKFGEDSELKEESLDQVVFGFLANKYGNLLRRLTGLLESYKHVSFSSISPIASSELESKINDFENAAIELLKGPRYFDQYFTSFELAVSFFNVYFNEIQPWKIKDQELLIGHLLFMLKMYAKIAYYISPVMPKISKEMLDYLGYSSNLQGPLNIQYHLNLVAFPRKITE